jgi:hypothetical protein
MRAKISTSLLGNQRTKGRRDSEDTRAKKSAVKLGNQNAAGHSLSAERRTAISVQMLGNEHRKGATLSAEHRAAISRANMGNQHAKGRHHLAETTGYAGAHMRHRQALPRICAFCGRADGPLHVALRRDVPAERLLMEDGRRYSLRPEDYMRLCAACHVQYDRAAG